MHWTAFWHYQQLVRWLFKVNRYKSSLIIYLEKTKCSFYNSLNSVSCLMTLLSTLSFYYLLRYFYFMWIHHLFLHYLGGCFRFLSLSLALDYTLKPSKTLQIASKIIYLKYEAHNFAPLITIQKFIPSYRTFYSADPGTSSFVKTSLKSPIGNINCFITISYVYL